MRAISGLWRWRDNPLRRATDLAEAWLALAVLARDRPLPEQHLRRVAQAAAPPSSTM